MNMLIIRLDNDNADGKANKDFIITFITKVMTIIVIIFITAIIITKNNNKYHRNKEIINNNHNKIKEIC